MRAATPGRLLLFYLAFRQITAALGLKDIAGHAQMVRPLLAPMAEAAAENRFGPLPDRARFRIRAFAAATDNIGLFFGEDIFIAIASILLIKSFLAQNGIELDPLRLSVWAIPTAIAALAIHGRPAGAARRQAPGARSRSSAGGGRGRRDRAPARLRPGRGPLRGLRRARRGRARAPQAGGAAALFWGLLAVSFVAGDHLGDFGNGVLVIALSLLAGFRAIGRGAPQTTGPEERRERSARHGDRLFVPALIVPAVALLGSLVLKDVTIRGVPLLEPRQPTILSLALGVVTALGAAALWLRPKPLVLLQEGRRLIDAIGWAAILPQALAALGGVFAAAGVGKAVFALAARWITPSATASPWSAPTPSAWRSSR